MLTSHDGSAKGPTQLTLQQLAPRARTIAAAFVMGCTLVGALACSEIVRAFTRPHAPRNGVPA